VAEKSLLVLSEQELLQRHAFLVGYGQAGLLAIWLLLLLE